MIIRKLLYYTVPFLIFTFAVSCVRKSIPVSGNDAEDIWDTPFSRLTDEEFFALADYFSPTNVSSEDAMVFAEAAFSMLEKAEPATKSISRHAVSAIPFLGNLGGGMTKSVETQDTLAYIVNFSDGNGFAVIAADRRVEPILAIIPEGKYESNHIPPGAATFFANIGPYLQRQIENHEKESSKYLSNALKAMYEYLDYSNEGAEVTKSDGFDLSAFMQPTVSYREVSREETQITPLVTTKWGQDEPYNTQCPIVQRPIINDAGAIVDYENVNALAGCVATATAQIMAYWEYPSGYDWDEMKANPLGWHVSLDAQNDIARLMRHIGDGVHMTYGFDASSARTSDVPSYLSSVGYSNYGNVFRITNASSSPYSGSIFSDLQIGRPVIMSVGDLMSDARHAFIVDGIQRVKINYIRTVTFYSLVSINPPLKEVSYIEERPTSVQTDTYHCNLGWDGWYDGWYEAGLLEIDQYEFDKNCYIVHNVEP